MAAEGRQSAATPGGGLLRRLRLDRASVGCGRPDPGGRSKYKVKSER